MKDRRQIKHQDQGGRIPKSQRSEDATMRLLDKTRNVPAKHLPWDGLEDS